MTPLQFVEKWRPVALTERAAAQSHFNDLCHLFDHPTPIEADPVGERFTFEKGVKKSGGGDGFADVWYRGHFAWEYKKRRRNLTDALDQLSRYALALESPPLHIACDTEQFRIVTAYTNAVPRSYDLSLEDLLDHKKRDYLAAAFHDPKKLEPGARRSDLTREAADKFSTLSDRLRSRGHSKEDAAHFVNQLVFLFFAEDVGLLDRRYFRRVIDTLSSKPKDSKPLLSSLFQVFKTGGRFGLDQLPWINGGLFDDRDALDLDEHEIGLLKAAGSQDWGHIDPTIFGTLFERFLDPDKRSQIGAHYTDAAKIMTIVRPVIIRPLELEWISTRDRIEGLTTKARTRGVKAKEWSMAEGVRSQFMERLRNLSILDPACGSGNFLYLALQAVKDLESKANQECEVFGLPSRLPMVGPEILRGIEINPLAAELARTAIWIGDIQWAIQNGIRSRPQPLLRKLDNIENRDALLTPRKFASVGAEGASHLIASEWPSAEYIVGNPPFLGGKLLRRNLGNDYVESLFSSYDGGVAPESDLVVYWFEKAREHIAAGHAKRAGLVATNSIRGGVNRQTLEKINHDARVFEAWSDEPWVIDGANVRVSIICFGRDTNNSISLNGQIVDEISSDLKAGLADLTHAIRLRENIGHTFQGVKFGGPFELTKEQAERLLKCPTNPNGRKNQDVIRPWVNGMDLTRRPEQKWCIDFPSLTNEKEAQLYERPFDVLKAAFETENALRVARGQALLREREARTSEKWWVHQRPRQDMKDSIGQLKRYILTPEVSKHRIFQFVNSTVLGSGSVYAISSDNYQVFGILHSKFHEEWSLRLGSSLEDRPRYTPSTTFETFPFPDGVVMTVSDAAYRRMERLEAAAEYLDQTRRKWLYPDDLVKRSKSAEIPALSQMVPVNAEAASVLAERTMTRLYNEKPSWLKVAHCDLDAAVAQAYGWPEDIDLKDGLSRLLALNLERAANTPSTAAKRAR